MRGLGSLRIAFRRLKATPGESILAALSLGLGLGLAVSTAVVAHAIFLSALPVAHPELLGTLDQGEHEGRGIEIAYPAYEALRDALSPRAALAAWQSGQVTSVTDTVQQLRAEFVSTNYFSVIGVAMTDGRGFLQASDARDVLEGVVSQRLTARSGKSYGVGSTVRINGLPVRIVGIVPAGFQSLEVGSSTDVWLPMHAAPLLRGRADLLTKPTLSWLHVIGRRLDGVAPAELAAIATATYGTFRASVDGQRSAPTNQLRWRAARTGVSRLGGDLRQPLLWAAVAVTLTLLTTLANVLVFTTVRLEAAANGIAVRLALGASRARVVMDAASEGVLVVGGGLAAAIWVGVVTPGMLATSVGGGEFELVASLGSNGVGILVLVSAVVVLATCVAAYRWVRRIETRVLLQGMAAASSRTVTSHVTYVPMVVQIAVSTVLTVQALALGQWLLQLRTHDLGFASTQVVVAELDMRLPEQAPATSFHAIRQRLVSALQTMPGSAGVSSGRSFPLSPASIVVGNLAVHDTTTNVMSKARAELQLVDGTYFETLGITFVEGQPYRERDEYDGSVPVVVNETFAARFGDRGTMRGRTISYPGSPRLVVQGVVRDASYHAVYDAAPIAVIYGPHGAWAGEALDRLALIVRTQGMPHEALAQVKATIEDVAPSVPITRLEPLDQYARRLIAREQALASLSAICSAIGIVLLVLGVYAAVSAVIRRRMRDAAVRMCLGASSWRAGHDALRDFIWFALAGLAGGCVVAIGVAQPIRTWLGGASTSTAFAIPAGVLGVAAAVLLAALIPIKKKWSRDLTGLLRSGG